MTKQLRFALVGLLILYVIYGVALWKVMTKVDDTQEEVQQIYHTVATMPEIAIELEPVIREEIANKEAKEPEWGFDFDYVCRVVAAESRGEPYEGQVAVAQCIWNTAMNRGMTPVEVVNMKNRYADPVSSSLVTESVIDACRNVFLGVESVTEENIEYFYSTKNGFVSAWHENALEHVITIGNHKFFKEK